METCAQFLVEPIQFDLESDRIAPEQNVFKAATEVLSAAWQCPSAKSPFSFLLVC